MLPPHALQELAGLITCKGYLGDVALKKHLGEHAWRRELQAALPSGVAPPWNCDTPRLRALVATLYYAASDAPAAVAVRERAGLERVAAAAAAARQELPAAVAEAKEALEATRLTTEQAAGSRELFGGAVGAGLGGWVGARPGRAAGCCCGCTRRRWRHRRRPPRPPPSLRPPAAPAALQTRCITSAARRRRS